MGHENLIRRAAARELASCGDSARRSMSSLVFSRPLSRRRLRLARRSLAEPPAHPHAHARTAWSDAIAISAAVSRAGVGTLALDYPRRGLVPRG